MRRAVRLHRGKGGRGAKTPPDETQKTPAFDSFDLSCIDRPSFLEPVQQSYGNPLHSTALEEDLNLPEEGEGERRGRGRGAGVEEGAVETGSAAAAKQRGAAGQRKEQIEGKVEAGPGKEGGKERKTSANEEEGRESDVQGEESDSGPAPKKTKLLPRLAGKRPSKRQETVGQMSAARPVKNVGMKRKRDSGRKTSDGLQSQRRQPIPSSADEVTDEDKSWTPSPKKTKTYGWLGQGATKKRSSDRSKTRKSSSGGDPAEPEETSRGQQRETKTRKSSSGSDPAVPEETSRGQQRETRRGRQGTTELDVVLEAFVGFCDQYRESVASPAVRRAVDSFSTSVQQQLTEQIDASKQLGVLRRDNSKVASLIRRKTQKLLDAKYELNRAEKRLCSLQKEEARLALRLADLKRSRVFLRDIKQLHRQYVEHRRKHPEEKEEFGASSLPALLLETKSVLGAEHQLKTINNRLADRLQETRK